MTSLCVRGLPARRSFYRLTAFVVIICLASQAFAAELIKVSTDQARIIKFPERAATVVIGNPLIADISIQRGGIAVVTGKAYGMTNFIVMDRSGAVLTENMIEVQMPRDVVVVYRGVARETYSCTPNCSERVTLGDDSRYFNEVLNESATRNSQALAAGSSAPH